MTNEAYECGMRDYPRNVFENPYPDNSFDFRRWLDGWIRAAIRERDASQSNGDPCGK